MIFFLYDFFKYYDCHYVYIHVFIVLVDPGRLEIDLMSSGPKSTADHQSSSNEDNYIIIWTSPFVAWHQNNVESLS